MELHTLSIHQLQELLVQKEVGCEEITKASLERIRQVDDRIRAFTVTNEEALAQARADS